MSGLHDIIGGLIAKNGPMSVASFMELALQHPEFGYYRRGNPVGRSGDFITAPEISQMFGEMIGLWCAEVWRQMGSPEHFVLLELGPGHGTLMQDALRATAKISGFHTAADVYLCESNETFRDMQRQKLADFAPHYINDFAQLPPVPMLIIANEFFDALPIRQFEKGFQGWGERMVAVEDGRLVFTLHPLDPAMMMLIPSALSEAPVGTVYEISVPSLGVMRDLARHIVRHSGAFIAIDYGYVEADGKPTLQAVSGHQYAPVLERPGEVDLTALVDFSALRRAAVMQNAKAFGPVGQGDFLRSLGIDVRAAQLKHRATDAQAADIDSALRRLTDSAQMGSLFKVMAIAAPQLSELPGF